MQIIDTLIATPIGYIMAFCFNLIGNYGLTIIAFTVIVKLITLPIGILVQKNSIKMVKMQPMIDALKRKYPNKSDKDQFMEEQIELFKRENYNSGLGCLPMIIQIPVIIGIIYVIYNPLKHLLRLSNNVIETLTNTALDILSVHDLGMSAGLTIIDLIQNSQYTQRFASILNEATLQSILQFDTSFFGLNLAMIPSLSSALIVIPILAAFSAFALSIIQNKENVLQQQQSWMSQWGMTIFIVLFSLYFTFTVPAGVGLYWIMSNLLSILQVYVLNYIYNPKKYIDYDYLEQSKKENEILKEIKKQQKIQDKIHAPREKADYKRFMNTKNKQLVFYSEKSGFYKYYENVIDEIINRSDIIIHYITSDPNDAIFNKNIDQIIPYYIGEKRLIPTFMKMDADIVVMTMPDLDNFHIKKSMIRKDIEYIYMFHAPLSFIMTIRDKALDNYDTIFCTGIHQVHEIRESEKLYSLPQKTLIECGYGVIENMRKHYEESKDAYTNKSLKTILVAPTWNEDNILDSCIDEIIENLYSDQRKIIVRPHPEYIKRYPSKMEALIERYHHMIGDYLEIQTDFSSNETVYSADILITDWSWIAYEYSLATLKPSVFINTKMKVENPNWDKLPLIPLNLSLRNKIGLQIEKTDISTTIRQTVEKFLGDPLQYKDKIKQIEEEYIFNFDKSGAIGATYIISRLKGEM